MNNSKSLQSKSLRISSNQKSSHSFTDPNKMTETPEWVHVRQRAQKAKHFFEQIGLTNGDLPRNSDNKSLPYIDENIPRGMSTGTKWGARWKKPPSPVVSPSSNNNFTYSFPHQRSCSWNDMILNNSKQPNKNPSDSCQNTSTRTSQQKSKESSSKLDQTNVPTPKMVNRMDTKENESKEKLDFHKSKNNGINDQIAKKILRTTEKSTISQTKTSKPKLAIKSNSYDLLLVANHQKSFVANTSSSSDSNMNKKSLSMDRPKTLKVIDKNLTSLNNLAANNSYSSSYENVTAAEYAEAVDRRNKRDKSSHSLPSSTKHKIKKKEYSAASNSRSIDEKASKRPVDASEIRDHLEIIKQREETNGISETDGILGFHQERNLQNFAHYDCQSMTFNFNRVLQTMQDLKRKSTDSGASKANSEVNTPENIKEIDAVNARNQRNIANDLVDCCKHFVNEVGGEREREVFTSNVGTNASHLSDVTVQVGTHTAHARNLLTNHDYLSIVEVANTDIPLPPRPPTQLSYGIENVDQGANYYRKYFAEKEHQNFMMTDEKYGPIIISLKREKIDENQTTIYQYRVIVRTTELVVLRGSILEEAVQSKRSNHLSGRSCTHKDVLQHICPFLNFSELRLADQNQKLVDALINIDEQRINNTHKIGVLYSKAGQTTEEQMYNNEFGSPAFYEFLEVLGHKVDLLGFDKENFRGGLDIRTGSSGEQSVYTRWNNYQIMYHVSTMLPFDSTNPQQLPRKRHIGNDIVTIVFQEPGSSAFSPESFRSQFQHIFIVVRVVNPCSDDTCYRVAVTRAQSIPRFGPPIPPEKFMFRKSAAFREFLLTKVVNAENVAYENGKFKSLAMTTRQQYLEDAIRTYQKSVSSSSYHDNKFTSKFAALSTRRHRHNEKSKFHVNSRLSLPITVSCGALTWPVTATDFNGTQKVSCILGISNSVLSLIEINNNKLIFSIPCLSILGWLLPVHSSSLDENSQVRDLSVYFGRGEKITFQSENNQARLEVVQRLGKFTRGTEAKTLKWRGGKTLEEMGVSVNYEGIITDIQEEKYQSGPLNSVPIRGRILEISQTSVATLTIEDIKEILQSTSHIYCVSIGPNLDKTPRKCSMELYHLFPIPDITERETKPNDKIDDHQKKVKRKHKKKSSENCEKKIESIRKHNNTNRAPVSKNHMFSALIYYGIRNDSSCTNTMSSTKSKRSLDSNNSLTKTNSQHTRYNYNSEINSSNINNNSIVLTKHIEYSKRKENARKNIMNEISKQVIKPIKTTDDFQSSKTQNSAKEDAIENTKKSIETPARQTQKNLTANIIKIKTRTKTQKPTKKVKSIEPVTKKEKEKTDRSQQVITSPTFGVTLLKSGNAAKDKRRTNEMTDSKSSSNGNCYYYVSNVSKHKLDTNRNRQKVVYRRAATTNIVSKKSNNNNLQLTPTSECTSGLNENNELKHKNPSKIVRANSEECILSPKQLLETNNSSWKGKTEPYSIEKFRNFPIPSEPNWKGILQAASEAEKLEPSANYFV